MAGERKARCAEQGEIMSEIKRGGEVSELLASTLASDWITWWTRDGKLMTANSWADYSRQKRKYEEAEKPGVQPGSGELK